MRDHSPAANLALSAEAQRLALIPAQVMGPDEIEAAREVVAAAQEALAEARANKQAAVAEALNSESQKEPSAQTIENEPSSTAEARPAEEPSLRASFAPRERREGQTAIGPRSPFESSSPGSTGQSLDIVVGDEAPHSHGILTE
jgi:sRNA-binding protein